MLGPQVPGAPITGTNVANMLEGQAQDDGSKAGADEVNLSSDTVVGSKYPANQSRYRKDDRTKGKLSIISTGAGFLPSTVLGMNLVWTNRSPDFC